MERGKKQAPVPAVAQRNPIRDFLYSGLSSFAKAQRGRNGNLLTSATSITSTLLRHFHTSTKNLQKITGFGDINFSDTKSHDKWLNQLSARGWTEETIKETLKSGVKKASKNRATNNDATAFVNDDTTHVVVDNITKQVFQVSDRIKPKSWIADRDIATAKK